MFRYLQRFIGRRDLPNHFFPVKEQQIVEAERRLGYAFPSQLRQFFNEVGIGVVKVGSADVERDPTLINRVLSPTRIADLLLVPDNPWRPSGGFMPGVMPFFDCGDNTYLVLKPQSSEPNAVYWPSGLEGQRISDSLEDFFFRLSEHADFYRRDLLERMGES